jgi:hypothetical protein
MALASNYWVYHQTLIVRCCRQFGLVHTNAINAALSYKRILCIEVAYTNYLTSSLNTFADKTPVPSSGVPFIYLFIDKKLYYNSSLSLNKSIDLTSTGL